MMKSESLEGTPDHRERILEFVRQFCEPETCAAMQFYQFVNELDGHDNTKKVDQ